MLSLTFQIYFEEQLQANKISLIGLDILREQFEIQIKNLILNKNAYCKSFLTSVHVLFYILLKKNNFDETITFY